MSLLLHIKRCEKSWLRLDITERRYISHVISRDLMLCTHVLRRMHWQHGSELMIVTCGLGDTLISDRGLLLIVSNMVLCTFGAKLGLWETNVKPTAVRELFRRKTRQICKFVFRPADYYSQGRHPMSEVNLGKWISGFIRQLGNCWHASHLSTLICKLRTIWSLRALILKEYSWCQAHRIEILWTHFHKVSALDKAIHLQPCAGLVKSSRPKWTGLWSAPCRK